MSINKEQALKIGDELVGQERSREIDRRNGSARRVPLWYQFSELKLIEPWERPVILSEAVLRAMRDKSVAIIWIGYSSLVALWIWASNAKVDGIPSFSVWAVFLAFIPVYFYRREVVRKHVREILSARKHNNT